MFSRLKTGRAAAWVVLAVAIVLTAFPFYWMVRTALTPAADLYGESTSLWPDNATLINFQRVLGLVGADEARAAGGSGARIDFLRYTVNSVVYSGLIAAVQTFCCAMAGYAFARLIFQVACSSSIHAFMVSTWPEPPGHEANAWVWISGRTSPPMELVIHLFSTPSAGWWRT